MTDTLSSKARSQRMALVKGKNTQPEMIVRRMVHSMGYRYRLHGKLLPGRPDIVFASRKKVIFVHGCFWHRHSALSCKLARLPKSKLQFWLSKLNANQARDQKSRIQLRGLGWKSLVIWECQLKRRAFIERKIRSFLDHEID